MKDCFVIMPFSTTSAAHSRSYWNNFYKGFLQLALKSCGYKATRADARTGCISQNVISQLAYSRIVLAVLTDFNPNVLWELGVRHSMSKRTIMLLENTSPIPFSFGEFAVLKYHEGDLQDFSRGLKRFLSEAERPDPKDSPIARYLTNEVTSIVVNRAIGLRNHAVALIREAPTFESAIESVQELQDTLSADVEQVSVVARDMLYVHARTTHRGAKSKTWFRDEASEGKPLYPEMLGKGDGCKLARVIWHGNLETKGQGRWSVLAYDTIQLPAIAFTHSALLSRRRTSDSSMLLPHNHRLEWSTRELRSQVPAAGPLVLPPRISRMFRVCSPHEHNVPHP